MFKIKLAAAFVLLSLGSYAQHTVSGTVHDVKGQRLVGATVQIRESNRASVTDEFGQFSLVRVPDGTYTLQVRFLGYTPYEAPVSVQGGDVAVAVRLEENATMTDEVVVTATRANAKTPTTFTTVGRQAIQKQNFGQDLPFLLNWTPSVVTTSDAGAGVGYTGIRIRGSDGSRVNVTINGVPYNDSESLGSYWVDIPDIASSSQSIQIQRGVGSSTNGAGAFGASVNLQTNTRKDDPYAETMSSAGSFGTLRNTLSLGTGLLRGKWVIDGRVSKIKSDGFIDRASSDLQSYYFAAGFYAGNTMIKAITFGGKERTYQAWYGVPQSRLNNDLEAMQGTIANEGWNEAQAQNLLTSNSRTFNPYTYKNQVDDYKQDHYQLHVSQRLGTALTANVALHFTPGKGYYEEYRYSDKLANYGIAPVTIGDSVVQSTNLVRRRWLDNKFYGFTYSLNYEKEKANIVLGGGWNRYDGDHYGEVIWAQVSPVPTEYRYYFNNGDKRDFNIYGKTTYDFSERITGFVDLQYRKITYTVAGTENKLETLNLDKNFNFFNPKAGLTYTFSEAHQFYTSYSIGQREPVREDFANAPAGQDPKAEVLRDFEIGYRGAGKRLILNANYYLMSYKDQLVLTGELNDTGASLRTNVDESYRMGIELDGTFKISSRLAWNANITLSKNKIKNFTEVTYDYGANFDEYNIVRNNFKDTDISFSPGIIAGSSLTYRPMRNFEATLLSKYVSRQYLDNTSNTNRSIDPYLVNDVRISYTVQPGFMKEAVFSLLVNNVLDEKYESNGYTWGYFAGAQAYRENYYFPQAGRNFMAMITLKF